MNNDSQNSELQKAIAEWKKKFNVGKNDPLMATVELWQILVEQSHATDPSTAFRRELEHLTEIAKAFSKQSCELTGELRQIPRIKNELWLFPYFTVVLVAVAALIIGFFVGKFFPQL